MRRVFVRSVAILAAVFVPALVAAQDKVEPQTVPKAPQLPGGWVAATAPDQLEARIKALENRVAQEESNIRDNSSAGAVMFLYGAFCALWAQNTGRSAWLWFFMGMLFNVITVIVLLAKNSDDRKRRHGWDERLTG